MKKAICVHNNNMNIEQKLFTLTGTKEFMMKI